MEIILLKILLKIQEKLKKVKTLNNQDIENCEIPLKEYKKGNWTLKDKLKENQTHDELKEYKEESKLQFKCLKKQITYLK